MRRELSNEHCGGLAQKTSTLGRRFNWDFLCEDLRFGGFLAAGLVVMERRGIRWNHSFQGVEV